MADYVKFSQQEVLHFTALSGGDPLRILP